jgi:hypothetical protein
MKNKKVIKALVVSWLAIIFFVIALLFWKNEYVYSLPTPVPANYHSVKTGEYINLKGRLSSVNKPLFIHFFNPSCPCSRFNIPQFKSLVKKYGDKVSFAIVVVNKDRTYSEDEIQDRFDLKIPVLSDTSIAISCGVYSTPQAVILDSGHKLYYRGNYNRSRYCTDKSSDFAQIALDSLLNNSSSPFFSELATKAYGCQIKNCKIK